MITLSIIWTNIIIALLLTIFVEEIALFFQKEKNGWLYLALIPINIITNTTLNYVIVKLPYAHIDWMILGLEVIIILVEACLLYLIVKKWQKALRISLICNVFSYVVGMLLMPFLY